MNNRRATSTPEARILATPLFTDSGHFAMSFQASIVTPSISGQVTFTPIKQTSVGAPLHVTVK